MHLRLLPIAGALVLVLAPPTADARRADDGGASADVYTAGAPTDVLDQPGGKRVFTLMPGQAQPLLKRGGPGGTWCKIGRAPQVGWVECSGSAAEPRRDEGGRRREDDARQDGRRTLRCDTKCDRPPLFSRSPSLTATDREVLALCPARPDARLSVSEVRRFFAAHYDDARLQRALSAAGRPGSGAGVRERNLDWLVGLWISTGPRNAFQHVFCGDDWDDDKLGGLHWLPRYAQLEADGKLCYGGPVRKQAVVGDQYLIRFRGLAPWSCATKPVGGFPTDHDPVEMIAAATRAFVRCCDRATGRKEGGVYAAPDLGPTKWRIWCGTRNGTYGIATVYPTDERVTCSD